MGLKFEYGCLRRNIHNGIEFMINYTIEKCKKFQWNGFYRWFQKFVVSFLIVFDLGNLEFGNDVLILEHS